MNFFKAFQIMGILSSWLEKAVIDGVIDQDEIVELIKTIMSVLNVRAEIKIDMN
jgi:hypothetical protein